MGFYSGDFQDKALQSSIGNILCSKFGDVVEVNKLLQEEKLRLVSMGDSRGLEIKDNEILYISEAQNTSIDLIKLCISRAAEGSKIIIEGDFTSQVDSVAFEGDNNGLKRVINAFKGHPEFGYVQLQHIYRSRIAQLCDLL
jgi:predicted ribonuclease YlaK